MIHLKKLLTVLFLSSIFIFNLASVSNAEVNEQAEQSCLAVYDPNVDYEFCKAIEKKSKEEIFAYLDNMLKDSRKESDIYYYTSIYLYDIGEMDKAVSGFTKALETDSKNPYIYYYRHLAYLKKEDKKNMFKDLKKSISFMPDGRAKAMTYLYLATCYNIFEEYMKSFNAIDKAMKLAPDERLAYELYAKNAFEIGAYKLALKYFKIALAMKHHEMCIYTDEQLVEKIEITKTNLLK